MGRAVNDQERIPVAERFAAKVQTDGDHQLWAGATSKGLGIFKLDGRPEKAPRVAWLLAYGSRPTGALKRLCDRPGCVAPAHHEERTPIAASPGRRRRLPRGGGHIRQRSPGSYTVEIVTGVDPLDRRRKPKTSFTVRGTFEDAATAAEEFRAHARAGGRINLAADGTFGELLDRWMAHARLEASTRRTYQGYIDNHIKPALGSIPLRDLGTYHFDRFYSALAERGGKCQHCWWRLRHGLPALGPGERYQPGSPKPPRIHTRDCTTGRKCRHCQQRLRAGQPPLGPDARFELKRPDHIHQGDCVRGRPLEPATERQIHAIIHRALTQARKWKLMTTNPADDTTRSPVPMPEVEVPTAGDVARVLNTALALDRRLGVFIWMAMITQGRRGEAAGVRWRAIDLETGALRIEGSLESGRHWKPYPKNRKGRTLRLDPLTLALLWEERQLQEELADRFETKLVDDAWLFADPLSPDGSKPMDPDLLSKRFHKLCERLGVRMYRNLYGLRHYGATSLVKAGVDIRTVAGRLGNDPAVTLRRYAHVASDADLAAVIGLAERMAEFMANLDRDSSGDLGETCPQGHPWAEDNIYRNPATGARMCRECARARQRRPFRVISGDGLQRSG
jgi:integrase